MPAPQFRRYLRRISRHQQRGYIFHYDSTVRDLRIWYWYVVVVQPCCTVARWYATISRPLSDADERIAPADLPNFRLTHEFRAPCCLCACQDVEGNYTEAAMFIAEDGPNLGKYMAGCASKHCGYLSECLSSSIWWTTIFIIFCLVCIDNMYTKINLVGRQFPLLCMFPLQNHHFQAARPNICTPLTAAGVPAPLPILYLPTNNTSDIASVSEATYGSEFWCHQYSQINILQGF